MIRKNVEPKIILPNDLVTVTVMNHIVEVQHMDKLNGKAHIKKLSQDQYVDLKTGEIRDFEKSENRSENVNSLRQTFKSMRYLINNNFIGRKNELHVTLTYEENMTDRERLYLDFDKFIKRLKYKYKKETTIDYINIVEPQERGAWHCHVLLRFNKLERIYIKNEDMRECWGHGFVTIKSLNNVDNIGAYLSAYLTDIELNDSNFEKACRNENEIIVKEVDGQKKKFIKGGRLHMYPSGMNIVRSSRGIEKPEREKMKFKDIKKRVGTSQPHYSKTIDIKIDDYENSITYIQYNLKRDNNTSKTNK